MPDVCHPLSSGENSVRFRAPVRAARKFPRALGSEQTLVCKIGYPGLTFGCALRRPGRKTNLAHRLSHLAHLFTASATMFDDALEKIRALLFPIDARECLCQRGKHRVLDTVGPRCREALDDHRLQPFDHDTAAHLHRRGDAEFFARDLGVEPELSQQWSKLAGAAATQQQRHLDAIGRNRGHHGGFDVTGSCGIDQCGRAPFRALGRPN